MHSAMSVSIPFQLLPWDLGWVAIAISPNPPKSAFFSFPGSLFSILKNFKFNPKTPVPNLTLGAKVQNLYQAVLDLMDPIGPIGGPAFSSQTLICGLWRRTTIWTSV